MFGVRAGSTKSWAPCEKAEWAPFSIRVVGDRPSGRRVEFKNQASKNIYMLLRMGLSNFWLKLRFL